MLAESNAKFTPSRGASTLEAEVNIVQGRSLTLCIQIRGPMH